MSLLEIYNETIRDLLNPKDAATGEHKRLHAHIPYEPATNTLRACYQYLTSPLPIPYEPAATGEDKRLDVKMAPEGGTTGTHFTCISSTRVQILTQKAL